MEPDTQERQERRRIRGNRSAGGAWAAPKNRPGFEPAATSAGPQLGPYETRYETSDGYTTERVIVQP